MWSVAEFGPRPSATNAPGGYGSGPPPAFQGAGPNGVPGQPQFQTGTFSGDATKLGRTFEVHLHSLNDVPRAYQIKRPKSYVVRALKRNSSEIGRSNEILGSQGYSGSSNEEDFESVDCSGQIMKLEYAHPMIYIQVEWSDGVVIGTCHIHRQDPRSQQNWSYVLTDPETGATANCGITLRLVENQPLPPPEHLRPPVTQFGQQPSPPVTQQLGPQQPRPPPHLGPQQLSLGPPPGPPPGPPVPPLFGPLPNLLELIRPGAKSQSAPEPVALAAPAASLSSTIRPAPMNAGVTYNQYTYTLPPGQTDVRAAPIEQAHAITQQSTTYSYDLPPVNLPTPTNRPPLAIGNGQPLLAIGNGQASDFNDYSHPGAYVVGQDHGTYHDGLTENWCAPPPTSWEDNLFGSDMDLEVKAMYSEPWDRPLDAFDRPLFVEENKFEDMDRSVIGREISTRNKFQYSDDQQRQARRKDGLPEFSFDKWVPTPKQAPKPLPAPVLIERQTQKAAPPPERRPKKVQEVRRAKGKINAELSLISKEQQHDIPAQLIKLSPLDPALFSTSFESQAIGCLEKEKPGEEKRVWLRNEKSCKAQSIDDKDTWLRQFWTQELKISVSCRAANRGKDCLIPNQDNFSITQTYLDMALYVVCDGHGPLGHVMAFRVVQSLPKFTFDLLQSPNAPQPTERVLLASFAEANSDLTRFARERNFDMSPASPWSCSGATCSAVLRIGANVIISWVGECGAFLATMTEQRQTVDMVTEPHTTDVDKELHRVEQFGAKVRPIGASEHNAKRIFRPGIEGPGIVATRTFGDNSVADEYGVTINPDFKTTSFGQVPGLVVLASGGLLDVLPDSKSSLAVLVRQELHLRSSMIHKGASALCELAQKIWQKEEKGLIDDVTCMLLHWDRPVPPPQAPPPPPPPQVTFPKQAATMPIEPTGSITEEELRLQEAAKVRDLFDPPQVTTELRSKPTIAKCKWLEDVAEVEQHFNMQALAQPDPTLGHRDIVAQVVSCIDGHEPIGAEKPVWFMEKGEPTAIRIDCMKKQDWLGKFQVANVQVTPISKRGRHHAQSHYPNQDNYSITAAAGNQALYVLCDGHGALGHLVSFRVAQTLPIFVLEGLEADTSPSLQHVFSQAFHKASLDLEEFAERHRLDFMDSGTSCAAVLRQGDKVFVSWLGDCRVLLATVGHGNRRVDFMSKPHLASSAAEYRRLCKAGLPVIVQPDDPARIFTGTSGVPGLTIARALGDFVLRQGVICEPEGANSSFEGVPGLVFLASGGLCEHFGPSPGEAMLQTLAVDGALLDKGPDFALQTICSFAQRQWQNRQNTYSEDISGILIQWVGAGRTPATLTAVPKSTSLQARLASSQQGAPVVTSLGQNASLASHMRMTAPITRQAPTGQVLGTDRITQAGSSLPARTAVAATTIATSQPITSQLLAQGESRKFLQAQPQNPMPVVTTMAKEVDVSSQPSFLQALPGVGAGRLTTVLE